MAQRNVRVKGKKAVIANIRSFDHHTRERFRVTTRRNGQRTRDRAVQVAPKETGYMARNIKVDYSPDEIVFEVFCDPDDYLPHGMPFYPFFVHHGTSRVKARPFLTQAYEWNQRQYGAEIAADIRYAMSRSTI